jgi:hypothetical protein
MAKYRLDTQMTLVSDTFQDIEVKLPNTKDLYIHQILVCLDPDDYTELAADKPILQLHISTTNETTILPYSFKCIYRKHLALADVVVGTPADQEDNIVLELSFVEEFMTSLRLKGITSFWVGAKSIFAGTLSVALLVSESDVKFYK